jgi:hypothetical protein
MTNGMQSLDDTTSTKLHIHHLKYYLWPYICKFCVCGRYRKYGTNMEQIWYMMILYTHNMTMIVFQQDT